MIWAWPCAAWADPQGPALPQPVLWQTAQAGEPVPLFPGRAPAGQPPAAPQEPTGASPPAGEALPGAPEAAGPAGAGFGPVVPRDIPIESVALGDLSPDSAGLLDAADGGLGIDMWRGTGRELVESLLPRIPSDFRSDVLRDLAIRLLLSRATAPAGEPGKASLLALRAERLMAMGEAHSAVALLEAGPPVTDNPALARMMVDGRFLDNDNAGACSQVQAASGLYEGDYWQKALAYCLSLSGNFDRAAIISDILRETGAAERDPAYFALVEALSGSRGVTVETLPDASGLELALARAANVLLPRDVLETDSLAVLRSVALSPNADSEVRLEAAERLAEGRAIAPGVLADIYTSVSFTQDELADPAAYAEEHWGARGRALLVRAMILEESPKARVDLLRRGWALARERGGETPFLAAGSFMLNALSPSAPLLGDAELIASALFAVGDLEEAMAWCEFALANARTVPAAARAWRTLWPLAVLADGKGEVVWDDARLAAWWDHIQEARPDRARAAAVMVYSLLESFGHRVDGRAWARLIGASAATPSHAPDIALWRALEDAAREGRRGETVLYAVIALGRGGRQLVNPAAVAPVVQALRQVGLETEARGLAVEAAVAAGA